MNTLDLAPVLCSFTLAVSLLGCGGTSPNDRGPTSGGGTLTVTTGGLVPGVQWQLNRPIDITLDRAVDFSSVSLESVVVLPAHSPGQPAGTYGPALDRATGEADPNVIRFQPHCPIDPSAPTGFEQGTDYLLIVRGSDTTTFPLRAADGTALDETIEIPFTTRAGTDPSVIFYDPVYGPPRVVVRGRPGVLLDDPESTRFELGIAQPRVVHMREGVFGGLQVDPAFAHLVPFGLPLNHYIAHQNRVSVIVEFDQPIAMHPANLNRIGLEFQDGAWRSIPTEVIPLVGCGRRGSAVRLRPLGTLPPGHGLRLTLEPGLQDLTGEASSFAFNEHLPLTGTMNRGAEGARVDAIFEHFTVGGTEIGSMEDTTSDLGAPRAFWGQGLLGGVETPNGLSRARSKWIPVGLAGHAPGPAPTPPSFFFHGTDAQGVVRTAGGTVVLEPAIIGPLTPAGFQPFSVDVLVASLVEPSGLYRAQPTLLNGSRVTLRPSPMPGSEVATQVFDAQPSGSAVRLSLGYGCYIPGLSGDCVPWNLMATFPNPAAATFEIQPQSFELYTFVHRDAIHSDHRVTITFDAAAAGPSGEPDESTAYSVSSGWTPDVTELSGTAWDFVRFEVQFELDVSGDGYSTVERAPILDFIKVPLDLRGE